MSRRLPPLNAVRAFEAASRNTSFSRAAEELSVTQGAISRHVAGLEDWLGVKLFLRSGRGVELTSKGATFARIVRASLDQLELGSRQLRERPDESTLRLKLPPTFAIRWLMPRLAHFHARNRRIDVQITTSHQPVDFAREDVDACIHSDSQPPRHAHWHRLFGERLLAVCSPRLLEHGSRLTHPRDLSNHVLICSLHRPRDWPMWLAAAGLSDVDANNGMKVENSALAYQAAIEGVGVVVAQRSFVEDDLREGRLTAPFALEVETDGAYYFGYSSECQKSERVAAFEDWILEAAMQRDERQAAPSSAGPSPLRFTLA